MAVTKLLQLYRNSTIVSDLDTAKSLIKSNAQGADGEILIARYQTTDMTEPKALVAVGNLMSGQSDETFTYLNDIDVEYAIATALARLTGGGQGATGQFVTEVTESNGVISVTYGAITSEDGTVVVNGYDLGVNYDGATIVLDSNGKLSVSASAGGGYTGKNAIAIDNKEISLVIDKSDVVLSQGESGLKTTLTVYYDSDEHTVNLCGIDGNVISSFDASEFIIDGMIQSAALVHENPDTSETGEFLAITFNTEHGETTTIYIDVSELIDTYTAGDGLALSDHKFSVKIADSDEGYLQVTEAGLKTEGITAISNAVAAETSRAEAAEAALEEAIEAAVAGESTTVVQANTSNTHVTVSSEVNGTLTTYTINESNIASASDLSSLQTQVANDETTISNIITSAGLNSDGSLTDVILPGSSTNLVDAITELESEISTLSAKVTKNTITCSDGSIEVTVGDSSTDIAVVLIDCGEYI